MRKPDQFVNAASLLARCEACGNAVLRQDVQVQSLGTMAALQEDQSPLQVGTAGRYRDHAFEVVGRVQILYDSGFWNEWYVHFGDGSDGWLGEAMGTYFINKQVHETLPDRPPEQLTLGYLWTAQGDDFAVTQRFEGQVVSFEGELPFRTRPGDRSLTFDLRSATARGATLDYSDAGELPRAFIGQYVGFDDLHFTSLCDRSQPDLRRMAPPSRLDCPTCGAPQDIKVIGRTQVVVCDHCGAGLNVTEGRFRVAWQAQQNYRRYVGLLPLGARGTLNGVEWECLGTLRRTAPGADPWDEFLLYNPHHGYRWLVFQGYHWSFVEMLSCLPVQQSGLVAVHPPALRVRYQDREYRQFQSGPVTVVSVIGEFYWQVRQGQESQTADYVDPPSMLSWEAMGEDIVWSQGEYLSPKGVQQAFHLDRLPQPQGTSPLQPNPFGRQRLWRPFAALAALALVAMLLISVTAARQPVYAGSFSFYADEAEHAHISDPFTLRGHTSNVVVAVGTDLTNRWMWLHMALINEQTHEAIDFGQEIDYYTGADEDGLWVDGSRNGEVVVPSVPTGTYSLLLDPESGTGSQPEPNATVGANPPSKRLFGYSVAVTRDVPSWSWFFAALFWLAVPPLIHGLLWGAFERRRWMQSDGYGMKLYLLYGLLILGLMVWVELTGYGSTEAERIPDVPQSVRNNPGSYRSHYNFYYHHEGGKVVIPQALLFSVFLMAICGLVYELLAGTLASYVLGDSVLQFSTVIGAYLFAMGIGSWLSKFIKQGLIRYFIQIEIMVGMVGGASAALLFFAFGQGSDFRVVLYLIVGIIGTLVGLEIPLILRILKDRIEFSDLISQVLTLDYVGALIASVMFPLIFMPRLGLVRTSFLFGLLNVLVALAFTRIFVGGQPAARTLTWQAIGCAVLLLAGFVAGDRLTTLAEEGLYSDPIIFQRTTPYQRIIVTQKEGDVRLYLNGHLQFASRDEYRYHECLVHPGLASVPDPSHVLVLGGGDGLAVRELLKDPRVQSITLVDLDPAMTDIFAHHPLLSNLNDGSLRNPRVHVINDDAFEWLKRNTDRFGFIVVDFPDPNSYSLGKLYTTAFYSRVRTHLADGAMFVVQSTSPLFARRSYWCIDHTIASIGLRVLPYHVYVPSFGEWGFVLAAESAIRLRPSTLSNLKFMTAEELTDLVIFPNDMAEISADVNRLDNQVLVHYYETDWEAVVQ